MESAPPAETVKMMAERFALLGILLIAVLVDEPFGVEGIGVWIGLRIAMDGPGRTVGRMRRRVPCEILTR